MTPTETQTQPSDLREYLRVIRARKVEILVVTLLAVGVALGLSLRQTKLYEARAKIVVQPVQNPTSPIGIQRPQDLDTDREIILSSTIAGRLQKDLGITTPVSALLRGVHVQVITDTQALLVSYDDRNPTVAADLANGFAQAFVHYRADQTQAAFTAAAAVIEKQVKATEKELAALTKRIDNTTDTQELASLNSQRTTLSVQLGVLQQRLLDLESTAAANASPAQLLQPATAPTAPIRPRTVRNAVIALVLGLVVGVGLGFTRERLDDRLRSGREVERHLGAPLLAAVPKVKEWRKEKQARLIMQLDPKSPFAEAYRTLATNVLYLASREHVRVFMVTSALRGEGKSTTAANLAVAMAESGSRVILCSADLRRSRVQQFFDLPSEAGLTDCLTGSSELADVAKATDIPNLRVITAGQVPANPAKLLRSRQAYQLMETLRNAADFVLLDTPPVLAVADASILAPLVDGVIYVMCPDESKRSALILARDQLEQAGARIVGGVYNNFEPNRNAAYSYYPYHHYYYQYTEADEPGNSNGRPTRARRRSGREGPVAERPHRE